MNEVYKPDGEARGFYRPLLEVLTNMGPEDFAERRERARVLLEDLGATFPLPGEDNDRVLPADWMPRIIPRDHWEKLSAGLLQRGKAINAWILDLYNGSQSVVPDEVIESSVFYRRDQLPASAVPVHVYGPDVVHLQSGEYVVLEDNVRVPSGVAYSEAVRKAARAAFENTFEPYRVSRISPYYEMLRTTLGSAAPEDVEDPTIAIVTSGPGDSAYFEHRRIAERCGIRLLTLDECCIEGGEVRMRSDGTRIDVIYRRVEGGYVVADLPELERVHREGRVGFANALGVGVADDKAVFAYVPAMIEHYLGEKPILNNAPTISLADPEQRAETLDRLPELVLKPREGYGGLGVIIGPEADRETLDEARRNVEKNPEGFVAQECLDFSMHVLDDGDGGQPGASFVDLRAFVLPAVDYVMPGGLTRVAKPGTRVVNSSSGGSFKDTWVLED
ncbi:MAG TPA: circularly permuted type 2 ATP-grasp protein [Rubrobacteraceae bacterium]|nr:circularly permuted type 2 ATP-grasp protein [Rubrobacteraceae bacterium]